MTLPSTTFTKWFSSPSSSSVAAASSPWIRARRLRAFFPGRALLMSVSPTITPPSTLTSPSSSGSSFGCTVREGGPRLLDGRLGTLQEASWVCSLLLWMKTLPQYRQLRARLPRCSRMWTVKEEAELKSRWHTPQISSGFRLSVGE